MFYQEEIMELYFLLVLGIEFLRIGRYTSLLFCFISAFEKIGLQPIEEALNGSLHQSFSRCDRVQVSHLSSPIRHKEALSDFVLPTSAAA